MTKTLTEDPAGAVLSFRKANASAIARVLERAERNAAKAARKQTSSIQRMLHPRSTLLGSARHRQLVRSRVW